MTTKALSKIICIPNVRNADVYAYVVARCRSITNFSYKLISC